MFLTMTSPSRPIDSAASLVSNLAMQIPPLESIILPSKPLTSHALAWSCDNELAVAADNSVHVLLPDYPSKPRSQAGSSHRDERRQGSLQNQFSGARIQFLTMKMPDPRINNDLFAAAAIPLLYDESEEAEGYRGVGEGQIGGSGSALNQVAALQWSPGGLGYNLRPILTVLLTTGVLMSYGEKTGKIFASNASSKSRGFSAWKILWGVGATVRLPDTYDQSLDRIKSSAWAKQIAVGRALLAYATEIGEVVLLSVQYVSTGEAGEKGDTISAWQLKEVGRFNGCGPHPKQHVRGRSPFVVQPD
jgi:Transcription factor IIIC subunit delta N-term